MFGFEGGGSSSKLSPLPAQVTSWNSWTVHGRFVQWGPVAAGAAPEGKVLVEKKGTG